MSSSSSEVETVLQPRPLPIKLPHQFQLHLSLIHISPPQPLSLQAPFTLKIGHGSVNEQSLLPEEAKLRVLFMVAAARGS